MQRAGDLQGLLSQRRQLRLGSAAQLSLGTGSNQLVSGNPLVGALHHGGMGLRIADDAAKLGVDARPCSAACRTCFRILWNQLAADGQIGAQTQNQGGGFDLSLLQSLAGKLLD